MKKGKIKINDERCKGCGLCVNECGKECIKMGDTVNKTGYVAAEFDETKGCNACKLCAIACPEAAIEVFEIIEVPEK